MIITKEVIVTDIERYASANADLLNLAIQKVKKENPKENLTFIWCVDCILDKYRMNTKFILEFNSKDVDYSKKRIKNYRCSTLRYNNLIK